MDFISVKCEHQLDNPFHVSCSGFNIYKFQHTTQSLLKLKSLFSKSNGKVEIKTGINVLVELLENNEVEIARNILKLKRFTDKEIRTLLMSVKDAVFYAFIINEFRIDCSISNEPGLIRACIQSTSPEILSFLLKHKNNWKSDLSVAYKEVAEFFDKEVFETLVKLTGKNQTVFSDKIGVMKRAIEFGRTEMIARLFTTHSHLTRYFELLEYCLDNLEMFKLVFSYLHIGKSPGDLKRAKEQLELIIGKVRNLEILKWFHSINTFPIKFQTKHIEWLIKENRKDIICLLVQLNFITPGDYCLVLTKNCYPI